MDMNAQKDLFFTESGMLRIRWWPTLAFTMYVALNVLTFVMVLAGGKGHADMFFHAPLIQLFG